MSISFGSNECKLTNKQDESLPKVTELVKKDNIQNYELWLFILSKIL